MNVTKAIISFILTHFALVAKKAVSNIATGTD